jgi:hypothetical protein
LAGGEVMKTSVKPALMYPVPEAAELMSLDRSQVYVLLSTGQLEWVNVSTTGKRPRVRVAHVAIEAFMRRRTVPARKAA